MVTLIDVRQPRPQDVVAGRFSIAGFGSGFEATVLWRVLGEDGSTLGEGLVPGVGSMGTVRDFGHQVTVDAPGARGAHVLLQVFGDDPSGNHPPGMDLDEVPVTLFTAMQGWRLHEVRRGDTLSAIVREQGEGGTRVADVFEANRDVLDDPDRIRPGQVLRVPLF